MAGPSKELKDRFQKNMVEGLTQINLFFPEILSFYSLKSIVESSY